MLKQVFTVMAAVALICLGGFTQANSLYVSNGGDGSVKVIDMSGVVSTYATGFSTPRGLAFDDENNLYVACSGDSTIRKVSPDGQVYTFATDLEGDLYGLAFHAGYIYATSTNYIYPNNSLIFRFATDGTISTFATCYTSGGLVIDESGTLFVTFGGENPGINMIDSSGSVSLFASGLVNSIGLARASSGDLYVAEFSGDAGSERKICRVASDGSVHDFATGVGTPYGLTFGEDGFLYATDFANGTISRIDSNGNVSLFVGGLSSPRFIVSGPDVVPEPSSIVALAGGIGSLLIFRRRRT